MEFSHLLSDSHNKHIASKSWIDDENHSKNAKSFNFEFAKEVSYLNASINLIKISIPSMFGAFLRRALETVNFWFIGRLSNPDYIAGVGLGFVTANFLCLSIAIGMAGGIETLASHAFGSKNNYLAGKYFQRAQVVITVIFLFQLIVFINIESILVFIGQSEETSKYAAMFIKAYLPGIYAYSNVELLRRYLSTQGVYTILTVVQMITFVTHILLLHLFVNVYDLNLYGVAIAANITYSLQFIICSVYIT